MLYNFCNNSKCLLEKGKQDIYKKPIFATFDLQYLDSRTRDSMRLLSQLIKCRNKDLYKFVAYYLSFRGLPLFSPYLTGLLGHRAICIPSLRPRELQGTNNELMNEKVLRLYYNVIKND
jgi:hypothetical protein